MSYKIEIADSTSHKIEISSSINDQTPIIQILEGHSSDINISHDIALLPADFNENVKTIIDSFLTAGYGVSIVPSGSFLRISTSGLQPSGNYSLVGHSHVSSDITNFNSSVSGLLPVKNVVSGSGIAVSDINGTFTVAVTGQFGLTSEQVDDRVSSLLSSGYGINLNYDDNNNLLTISTIGLQPSGNYSIAGHSHVSSDITDFISVASGASPVQTVAGRLGNVVLTKNDVGLNNVDNTSDINKPVSIATQNALNLKSDIGHLHTSSNITDFSSTVSGLLPVKNILSGSGISVTSVGSDFTVAVTGQFGLTGEQVDDRVSNLLVAGNYVNLNYNDSNDSLMISVTGVQPSGNYASSIHTHITNDITNFNSVVSGLLPVKNIIPGSYTNITSTSGNFTVSVTGLQPSGNYANTIHNHTSSQITDFNTSVSGLLPVVNISAGSNIVISNVGGNFIVGATGLQPSGNYSVAGHSHLSSDITNFNTSVSGLLTPYATINSPSFSGTPTAPTASSGTNNSQIANTQFVRAEISNLVNAAPSTLDTLNELATALGNDPNFATTITNNLAGKANLTGATFSGAVGGPSGDFGVLKQSGVVVSVSGHTHSYSDITNFASGVSDNLTTALLAGSFINLYYNSSQDTLTISASGLQPSGNYSVVDHTHTSSNITDFNSSVSGLLPTVANSGTNRLLTSTGSNVGVSAQANLTFNGSLLNVTGSGVFSSGLNIANQTASTIASFDNNKNVVSLSTSTYPSLTELAYVKGVTSSLQTQLDLKSNLNSPSFTGTPTVPTATSGTNSNQIASTSFVRTEISNLIGSSPATLDTLNELATALGNDPNFATTVTNNLAGKANLSGATFTGNVSAPTGNFVNKLTLNNIDVSVSGHSHLSANITDFNSSVSGLLPVKDVVASTGINISSISGIYTISSPEEVVEYLTAAQFPSSGNTSLLYIATDDSRAYRWVGSQYVEIGPTAFVPSSTPPTAHKNTHAINGTDPLTPSDIGAAQLSHYHNTNDIINFNTSVSGLLPITNILSGSNILISQSGTTYTVAVTGSLGLSTEEVDDRVASLLVAGSGINLSYNDNANSLTISVSGLQQSLTNPITGTGTSGYLSRFNSSTGLTNSIVFESGNRLGINTITPSGALHIVGSGLVASVTGTVPNSLFHLYSATSGASIFNVEGTNGSLFSVDDNLSGTLMSVNNNAGLPVFEVFSDDRVVAGRFNQNDFVVNSSGNIGIGNSGDNNYKFNVTGNANFNGAINISGVPLSEIIDDEVAGLLSAGSGISLSYNDAGNVLTISTSGLQPSGNYSLVGHSHTSSDISDFSTSVSGLLPVTNIIGGTNISIDPSGSSYTVNVSGSLGLTTEEVDDRVSNLLVAGSGINLDYNDGTDTLTIHNTSISPDEIEEYAATSNFPASGNVNILYRTTDDGRLYQWSGSVYAEIGPDSVTTGSHASQHYTNGIDPILNVVSRPATLTATVNNYAHNNADIIYLNADANRVITGLIAATDGTVKLLVNRSLYTITLDHQDTNSNPENRFMVPFGSDYVLQPGYSITIVYDSNTLRWRILA